MWTCENGHLVAGGEVCPACELPRRAARIAELEAERDRLDEENKRLAAENVALLEDMDKYAYRGGPAYLIRRVKEGPSEPRTQQTLAVIEAACEVRDGGLLGVAGGRLLRAVDAYRAAQQATEEPGGVGTFEERFNATLSAGRPVTAAEIDDLVRAARQADFDAEAETLALLSFDMRDREGIAHLTVALRRIADERFEAGERKGRASRDGVVRAARDYVRSPERNKVGGWALLNRLFNELALDADASLGSSDPPHDTRKPAPKADEPLRCRHCGGLGHDSTGMKPGFACELKP